MEITRCDTNGLLKGWLIGIDSDVQIYFASSQFGLISIRDSVLIPFSIRL